MKIVTYNVNGIRAANKLGIIEWIKNFNADIYCFQEVRANLQTTKDLIEGKPEQLDFFGQTVDGTLISKKYNIIYNCGNIAGYAGTMILSKIKPDFVYYDMGKFWQDEEGRTTTIIFGNNAIVNTYIPNGITRLEFKMQYLSALTKYLIFLKQKYNVLCVGDYNISHNEIDLTNPKECANRSVFLPIERKAFGDILNIGYTDSFRFLNPNKIEYSWRSYKSRQIDSKISAWKYRIDYICVTSNLENKLADCQILDLPYSDHLPVVLDLDI